MRKFLMFGFRVVLFLGLTVPMGVSLGQDEVTLVLSDWHLTEPHWEIALKEAMAQFEELHPNINVELDYVSYAEKETKYATEIDAGVGPDVFHIHAYSLASFMDRGYLRDLMPFIEAEEDGFLDAWYPQTLELMQREGAYHAMPGDFMSMVLFYNSNLFEQAGLDPDQPPTTWDEFLAYAQALTGGSTWGFGVVGAVDPGFELRFSPVLFSFGGDYLTADNKCSALNSPEAREAITFFVNLFAEHKVIPPGVTADNPGTVRQKMANEQIAMKIGSGWTAPIVHSINPDLNALEVLRAAPVPVKAGTDPEFPTSAWLSAWGMNPNTEHPEEAWELIKFITSQEMEQKWFDDARVLSSRQDVSGEYEPLLNDPFASVISAELANAKFVPQIREWPQIIEAVNVAVQEGFNQDKAPEEALKEAHDRINELLAGYRSEGETCAEF